MKITIAIPTCSSERIPLLIQTVKSIQAGTYKDFHIVIVADGNRHIYETAGDYFEKQLSGDVAIILNKERIGWIVSINRVFKEFDSEYYIYASDDLEFPADCIKNAMRTMLRHFPDGMGVVSLGKKSRCCFGLLGRKWADHFPNRQVFCPDYTHYHSDTELLRTVKELGLFAYPPERESQVVHHRMNDETRILARQVRTEDHEIRDERKERGYKWGIDFNLIRR